MVSCMRIVVAFFVLRSYVTEFLIVEGKAELISEERSTRESISSEEDTVCSNTEGEKNCKVPADETSGIDIQNDREYEDANEYDEYEDDDEYDEYDDYEDDELVQSITDDEECVNKHPNCEHWANLDPSECEVNPGYMLSDCKIACGVCKKHKRYSNVVPTVDGMDFGIAQKLDGYRRVSREEIEKGIAASREYMNRQIQLRTLDPELLQTCKNSHEQCTFWSLSGECDKNPSYMKTNCAPACFACDMLLIENRCPMDREIIGPDVWSPGDLDRMFRRLSSEPYKLKHDVKVLSSPDNEEGGPWVLTMENFVSNEEAERLIELGSVRGYERSTSIGKMKSDGFAKNEINSIRTSGNTWCLGDCIEDELVLGVNDRISNLTEIPVVNSEHLQLLKYEPGQFYKTHHDYIDFHVDRQHGVRIATAYLYLNDVEAGGGTNFPILNVTVMPKRGRVLIWPSVLDSDPNKIDKRTDHQALPVKAGVKYGANAWYHMRNYQDPNQRGCG